MTSLGNYSPMANQYDGVFQNEGPQGPVFGLGNDAQADMINKALDVGYQYPPVSGGDALRMESLDATLHVITYTLKNVKMWPAIPKDKAYSTVESYDLMTSYGDGSGIFNNSGDLPQTQDSGYLRKTQQVKFCGIVGEVTHPATLVATPFGDLVAREVQNKAVRLVQGLEGACFNGRSDCVVQEFDGIGKQIMDGAYGTSITPVFDPWNNPPVQPGFSVVIDLRGGDLTQDLIEQGSNQVVEQFGDPSDLHLAPRANSQLNKSIYPRERVNIPAPDRSGRVGFNVRSMDTGGGEITLNPNVFLRPGNFNTSAKKAPNTAATNVNAPNAPTAVTIAADTDSSGQSVFQTTDAGTYTYAVAAFNRFGESTAFTTATQAVTAGQKVTLTITDGGGANPSTGYHIYRINLANAAAGLQTMTRIPKTTIAGTSVFVDYNFYLPGTSRAYLIPQNDRFFTFKQLCPLVKIPLATVVLSTRWAQVLYGTPIVFETNRSVIYINVRD